MPAPASLINPPSPLVTLRASLPDLANHAFMVAIFCVLIALGLWWFRENVPLHIQLVYSLSGGMLTWAIIDIGRFFVDISSPYHFPRGWRAIVLIVAGCVIGHVLGTLIGDAYCGKSTWELFQDRPSMLVNFFLLSIVSGAAISFFFYANGKAHYLHGELEASQRQATEAQLQLLQSQLDPHMLFNTLANLRALIATDTTRATQMLDRLNDYLRSTLTASRATEHPLSAEFDRLRDYLELMSIRMGSRLHYTLDLPADLAQHKVPPLILQSLVENAIVHGLEPQVTGGAITVSARVDDDKLMLQVRDSGVGFDAASTPEGFGITQVRERLSTRYGSEATIEIIAARAILPWASGHNDLKTSPKGGCIVVVRIPLDRTTPAAF
jgi:Histidine kinase/Histidine kinase-, DNA gyrase B-, and HSP90-like ATPase